MGLCACIAQVKICPVTCWPFFVRECKQNWKFGAESSSLSEEQFHSFLVLSVTGRQQTTHESTFQKHDQRQLQLLLWDVYDVWNLGALAKIRLHDWCAENFTGRVAKINLTSAQFSMCGTVRGCVKVITTNHAHFEGFHAALFGDFQLFFSSVSRSETFLSKLQRFREVKKRAHALFARFFLVNEQSGVSPPRQKTNRQGLVQSFSVFLFICYFLLNSSNLVRTICWRFIFTCTN